MINGKVMQTDPVAEIVEAIVKRIVDQPEDVNVGVIAGKSTKVIQIQVSKRDIGLIIGKKWVHIQAIRTLMVAFSGKLRVKYLLELKDQ